MGGSFSIQKYIADFGPLNKASITPCQWQYAAERAQGYAPPIESLSSHVLSAVHSAVHCAMHCAVHCTVLSAVQLQRRKGRKIFGEGKSDDGRTDRLTDRISSCRLLSRDHSVEGIQWKVMLEVHNIYRQTPSHISFSSEMAIHAAKYFIY